MLSDIAINKLDEVFIFIFALAISVLSLSFSVDISKIVAICYQN